MEVTGRVSIGKGHAYIHLAPVQSQHQQSWQPRPTREQVQRRIVEGQLAVHESRLPLTRPALNSMLDYIQGQLNLPRGVNGGWSNQADDRLADMLAKQKRGSAAARPLALLDAPAATSSEQAPAGSPKSSSSSSESEEDEEGSRKRKQSSSSSSSSSTRKSNLRGAIRKLRADVAELAEGIQSQQELEEENQRLVALADALAEENQILRSALET